MMSSPWPRRVAALLAVAALVAAARWLLFRPAPVPVTVHRVARGRVEQTVTNTRAGTIKTRREAALSPEMGGRIVELPVRKGERVTAGQLLLRLAAADVAAEEELQARSLEAGRAAEVQTCQAAAQAEREAARVTRLAAERIVSTELAEKAETERRMGQAACEAARARTRQAEAALERARVARSKAEVRAPFAGVVADITAELGEWITPSPPGIPMPAVLQLFDPDDIYISAPLDEVDVALVKVGLPARVTMDSYPGRALPARVTRVAPYVVDVQQQSRTFEVEAELDDEAFARTLPPGLSADLEIVIEARDGVLRIPAHAVLEGDKALVLRDGRLAAVAVKIGLRNWEFAEIREGLAEGEAVVVSLDRPEVKEGARAVAQGEASE